MPTSPLQPVLILGAGRSGTKFLRNLLAASTACTAVPYDVNYVWRHGHKAYPHDALPASAATPATIRYIHRTLPRLARGTASATILVEKTSANTLRVPFVQAVFPDARYVHIVRHGVDVAASALTHWTKPPDPGYLLRRLRYVPLSAWREAFAYVSRWVRGRRSGRAGFYTWGPRYPGMDHDVAACTPLEVCVRQWAACVTGALDGLSTVPPDRVFSVRYEDLVHDAAVVEALGTFLNLPDLDTVLTHYHNTVYRDAVGRGRRDLEAEALQDLAALLVPVLRRAGYSADLVPS